MKRQRPRRRVIKHVSGNRVLSKFLDARSLRTRYLHVNEAYRTAGKIKNTNAFTVFTGSCNTQSLQKSW